MNEEIELLSRPLKDWVLSQGWPSLREIQKMAIKKIRSNSFGENDFILSATTASGKTEAAFLPLLTVIHELNTEPQSSFEILYISPLKALINDMIGRVNSLAECVGRKAFRRHGEITGPERHGAQGILLTTPESLEARFIRSPDKLASVFADLKAVIIDEIHAYFQSPRGPQLISLLTRLEAQLAEKFNKNRHMIPRIALSATISHKSVSDVQTFLRPEAPGRVKILYPEDTVNKNRIEVHLKAFRGESYRAGKSAAKTAPLQPLYTKTHGDITDVLDPPLVIKEMVRSLFDGFSKWQKGLIFTNSRREAEEFAELLNRRARQKRLVYTPEEFAELLKFAGEQGLLSNSKKLWALLTLAGKKGLLYTPEGFAGLLKGIDRKKSFLYTPEEFAELIKLAREEGLENTPEEFPGLIQSIDIDREKSTENIPEEFPGLLKLAREKKFIYTPNEFVELLKLARSKGYECTPRNFAELLKRIDGKKGAVYTTEEFAEILKHLASHKGFVCTPGEFEKLLKELGKEKGFTCTPKEFKKLLKRTVREKGLKSTTEKFANLIKNLDREKNIISAGEKLAKLLKHLEKEKDIFCAVEKFTNLLRVADRKKSFVCTTEKFAALLKDLDLDREKDQVYVTERIADLLDLARGKNLVYTREEFAGLLKRIDEEKGLVYTAREYLELFNLIIEKGFLYTLEELPELLHRLAIEKGFLQNPEECKQYPVVKRSRPMELEYEFLPVTRLFWPHHGSLDSWIRSRSEKIMRDQYNRSILVCTSTLELGIDVGTVEATAQIGPGYSVASLRQRLGRSGRRKGKKPILHAYVKESHLGEMAHPVEKMHLQTFRTLAQINLLEADAFEPPDIQRLNLSTLIQQLLSHVHQYHNNGHGVDPGAAHTLFVERGPFKNSSEILEPLISRLSTKYNALLEDQPGGLFLTDLGIKYVEHFTFYAAFITPIEYVVRAGARRIGSFAPRYPYGPGDQFLLGGAYWKVLAVDHVRRIMNVTRTFSGRAPYFEGDGLAPSDLIVQEMQQLYESKSNPELPLYTNKAAIELVEDGKNAYSEIFSEHSHVVPHGRDVILFPWVGTRKQITLICALKWMGISCTAMDVAIYVRNISVQQILKVLKDLHDNPLPDEHDLARYASKLIFEKHDHLLSPALKRMNFASAKLDVSSLRSTLTRLLDQ